MILIYALIVLLLGTSALLARLRLRSLERKFVRAVQDHCPHAGSDFPRVSVPKGSSNKPTTNAREVNATGVPSVP